MYTRAHAELLRACSREAGDPLRPSNEAAGENRSVWAVARIQRASPSAHPVGAITMHKALTKTAVLALLALAAYLAGAAPAALAGGEAATGGAPSSASVQHATRRA